MSNPDMSLLPIQVAPGGRYFQTADGRPFLFIGPNESLSWPGLSGLIGRKDPENSERYLKRLADHGVTIIRMMLEYAQFDDQYFELRPSHVNPVLVQFWDDLFTLCEKYGIRVLLAPYDNFWMYLRWHKHPYNVLNGGVAHAVSEFFTNDAVIQATLNRFRFVIQRWGKSPALAAWDLFNEVHPVYGGDGGVQKNVCEYISDEVRQMERSCCGYSRLQTVSIFGPEPTTDYEPLIFASEKTDFASTHIYSKGTIDLPKNTVDPALDMAKWVKYGLDRTPTSRPFTDSEHGPIHLFNDKHRQLSRAFDDEYERHLMWAHLASGGAGSGMRWPARNPHNVTEGVLAAYKSMSEFAKLIDWCSFTPNRSDSFNVQVEASRPVHTFQSIDKRQAVIWFLRQVSAKSRGQIPTRRAIESIECRIEGMDPGRYEIIVWNTSRGHSIDQQHVANSEADICFRIGGVQNDCAVAIRPVED